MQKQLKDFTEVELKAIAYDNLVQLEQAQKNIKVINDELNSRTQNAQPNKFMEETLNETTGTEIIEETAEVTGTE